MKSSSPTTPKPPTAKSILLIGPPGGGKTTLALQFPNVYVIDADGNLDGPELYLRKGIGGKPPINPNLDYRYDYVRQKDDGTEVPFAECGDRLISLMDQGLKDPWVKTIFVDGLTFTNNFMIAKTMAKQSVEEMRRQDWIPFRNALLQVILKLRGITKTTIMACHEEIITEDIKGVTTIRGYRPSVDSKLKDYFGGFFTDIWRCTNPGVIGGKQAPFKIQTVKDGLSPDLKSSCGMPPELDATWSEVNKYLKLS